MLTSVLYQAFETVLTEEKPLSVGLAVSGGVDSAALLLSAARKMTPLVSFVTLTVNHGFRAEAAREARYVKNLSESLGIPAEILTVAAEKPQTGVQNFGRAQRYALLAGAAKRLRLSAVALAHHADDLLETVMQRAERAFPGRAPAAIPPQYGSAGFPAVFYYDGVTFLRPFLALTRKDITDFLQDYTLTPLQDPSNRNEQYGRVRCRNFLNHPENKSFKADLQALAHRSQCYRRRIDAAKVTFFTQNARLSKFGALFLEKKALCALPPEEIIEILRHAVRIVTGSVYSPALSEDRITLLTKGFTVGGAEIFPSKYDIIIAREKRNLSLFCQSGGVFDNRFHITLSAPGSVTSADAGIVRQLYPDTPEKIRRALPVFAPEGEEKARALDFSKEAVFAPPSLGRFASLADKKIADCLFSSG